VCPLTIIIIIIIIIVVITNIIIKNDEVTGKSWRPHNGQLYVLYSPRIIPGIKSVRMRREGHVARMGARRGAYRILMEYIERKRPLGRPRHRRMCTIKVDLQEME
jgi:hypothetical protein